MSVSYENSKIVFQGIKDAGITSLSALPETWLGLLLQQFDVYDFDADAAQHYAEIRAYLEKAGTPCGANDMLIGAHARSLGMTLVTNNRREFDRMPGLAVENWV